VRKTTSKERLVSSLSPTAIVVGKRKGIISFGLTFGETEGEAKGDNEGDARSESSILRAARRWARFFPERGEGSRFAPDRSTKEMSTSLTLLQQNSS
jgi:hypothetical protein